MTWPTVLSCIIHPVYLCCGQPCGRLSASSGMFLVAGGVQETGRKSWAPFLHRFSNKSLTSFFLTPICLVYPNSFIIAKSSFLAKFLTFFSGALLSTNPLIVCLRFFAFSKYLAVSKLLYSSGLCCEVFRIISLYQNHHWISFPTFYIVFSLISVTITVLQHSWTSTFANRFSSYPTCYIQGRVFGKCLHFLSVSDPVSSSIQDMHQKLLNLNMLWKWRDNLIFQNTSLEQSGSGQHLQLTSTRQLRQGVCSAFLIPGHVCDYKTPPLPSFSGKLPLWTPVSKVFALLRPLLILDLQLYKWNIKSSNAHTLGVLVSEQLPVCRD